MAATDIIRSMHQLGFSRGEIYDTLTGIGLPGDEIQLLIDRVKSEFEDAQLETRVSKISEEVGKIFQQRVNEFKSELEGRFKQ